ncbi:MAG: DUF1552 domain-containing protein [Deltaproteobacteria bacterium]|nr:DUF1552 domain-containing protein [Myxococcales bacterium]MDP3219309.1 DUF1552 domain-containing protein [Deltaproteobacteria bacterium]
MSLLSRRRLLQGALGAASALPLAMATRRMARATACGRARRVIFFYFPDGIAGRSQNGEPSLWSASRNGAGIALGELLAPLSSLAGDCVFLHGLSMGGTDEGSHPGGAKKLLTGVDGGNGESVDQYLARTVGRASPFRHLYLGAMATQNNASGDKFISYPSAGVTIAPEDDPVNAFRRIFTGARPSTPAPSIDAGVAGADAGAALPAGGADEAADGLALDTSIADLLELRAALGASERTRLDVHLDALHEVHGRLRTMSPTGAPSGDAGGIITLPDAGITVPTMPLPASCDAPSMGFDAPTGAGLFAPENFPAVLRAQIDTMVLAMACGMSRVGVIQASQHTSELIMSRFRGTDMYDAGFDMRSHQASHYGARQDRSNRLFADFVKQVRWWVSQFAYLVEQLKSRPEGDGTMLDHSLVLLCSEVSDGNTHSHSDMPFVLAGRGGGCVTPGRVLTYEGRRHGDLLATIAQAMGAEVERWGDSGTGALPGMMS